MDLAASLARSLEASGGPVPRGSGDGPADAAGGRRLKAAGASRTSAPILQLNALPVPIDLARFRDAYGADNPTGDFEAAYRLRNLCNAIPGLRRSFEPSDFYVEAVWRDIVFGASGTTDYARHLLSAAQAELEGAELASLGGAPHPWLPVEAVQADWTQQVPEAPECMLDLGGAGTGTGGFALIGPPEDLMWTSAPEDAWARGGAGAAPALEGRVERVRLRALRVDLLRAWLDLQILAIAGWQIDGLPGGFYSSGAADGNAGIFPLLPTALVIATDIAIEGDWSRRDREILSSGTPPGIGPFSLGQARPDTGGTLRLARAHVLGTISTLVPYAPQDAGCAPGFVMVENSGAFVARFAAEWRLQGRPDRSESGIFPVLATKSIPLPAGATDIRVTVEIMTCPKPFETWKTVAVRSSPTPPRLSLRLSGTTFGPGLVELPAA